VLAGEEHVRLRPLYKVDNGGPRVTTKGWAIGRFFLAAVAAAGARAVVAPLRILDRSSRSTRGARSAWLERPQRRERRGADERRRTRGAHIAAQAAAMQCISPPLLQRCWVAAAASTAWEARMGEWGGATNPSTTQEAREKKPNFRLSQANATHYVNGPLNGPKGTQKHFKPVPFIPNWPFRRSVDRLDRSTV
jgi:hypothetical protein